MFEILKIAVTANSCIYLFDYFYFSKRKNLNPFYQYSFNEQIINFIYLLIIPIISEFYGLMILSAIYPIIAKNASMNIVIDFPFWLKYLYLFIGMDFIHYIIHRLQHTYRFFWEIHKVHHSSTRFNFAINYRISIFEGINNIPIPIFAALSGFTFKEYAVFNIIYLSYMGWTHMSVPKIKFLEYFLATPSNHRVHHWLENQGKCNYGGVLIIWDHLFKTYKEEDDKDHASAKEFGIKSTNDFNTSIIAENIPYFSNFARKINYQRFFTLDIFLLLIQAFLLKIIFVTKSNQANPEYLLFLKTLGGFTFLLSILSIEFFNFKPFQILWFRKLLFMISIFQIISLFFVVDNLKINPGIIIFVFTFITIFIESYKNKNYSLS